MLLARPQIYSVLSSQISLLPVFGLLQIKCCYIRKKELDLIEQAHGKTAYQKIIMYSKQAKHIYSQGLVAFKKDIRTFIQLRKKEIEGNQALTHDEHKIKKRLRREVERLKTLAIIQMLPFSGPLLIYYLYVYPTSIPSWFSVDTLTENYQNQCIKMQQKAIEYYKLHPLDSNFKLHHLKIQELRLLSQLLFGHFQDGVIGYNKIMAPKSKDYLFHPKFSRYLLLRNIKKEFKNDISHHTELKDKSIQELILWKYDRVMNGQQRLQFQPLHYEHFDSDLTKKEQVNPEQPKTK